MRFGNLFRDFINSEKTGGIVLLVCTVVSLLIANSDWGAAYAQFWHSKAGFSFGSVDLYFSLEHWINDGLMTIFFLLIGLEIEREIYIGELTNIKAASLPLAGALGGMLVPAAIYIFFNWQTPTESGYGIPMATDIAFALGMLSLLGNRVPHSLKVFLTALAIIDDLGAIVVIAVFYNAGLSWAYLGAALGIFGLLVVLNRLKVQKLLFYLLPGVLLWYCMEKSGVHATLSGVMLAFVLPFGKHDDDNISYRLQHWLHKPVAFFILPVFALANTGIVLTPYWYYNFSSPNSIGIVLGLVIGKPLGILTFCWLLIKLKWGTLPADINWKLLTGAGILAGIGFIMSIFIANLAFEDAGFIQFSKVSVLMASLIATVIGLIILFMATRSKQRKTVSK